MTPDDLNRAVNRSKLARLHEGAPPVCPRDHPADIVYCGLPKCPLHGVRVQGTRLEVLDLEDMYARSLPAQPVGFTCQYCDDTSPATHAVMEPNGPMFLCASCFKDWPRDTTPPCPDQL